MICIILSENYNISIKADSIIVPSVTLVCSVHMHILGDLLKNYLLNAILQDFM